MTAKLRLVVSRRNIGRWSLSRAFVQFGELCCFCDKFRFFFLELLSDSGFDGGIDHACECAWVNLIFVSGVRVIGFSLSE